MNGFISPKDSPILQNTGIQHIGDRTCENCCSSVPIYLRDGEEISVCLACDTKKLAEEKSSKYIPPKRRELVSVLERIEYIPPELQEVNFEDYIPKKPEQEEAMKLVHQFIKGEHKSLVFQGAPGTGKSHLFRCAAREMKQKTIEYEENGKKWTVPITVLFLKIPELMKTIQSTFGSGRKDGLTEAKILDAITKVDVLILDEIGGERSKSDPNGFESWSGDIHYQILDHRQGGRNLYNLNYDSKSVKSKYGEVQGKRILSRMMFEAKHHHVVGPDHRIIGLK